jgi:hypothetical protein
MENTLIRDVKVLDKLLNSPILLDKYPVINHVSIERYGNIIDVFIICDYTKEFYEVRDDIKLDILNISKMAGVESRFKVYP